MKKLYWRIDGFDSFAPIFKGQVEFGQFTERQIRGLLQMLTAKAGLSFDEIVGACARRKSKLANTLLDVQKDWRQATYRCGSNPYFAASVVDENGEIVVYPTTKSLDAPPLATRP
jgi:hypothetical protein